MIDKSKDYYVLARAKAVSDGSEVVGYVGFSMYEDDRGCFCEIRIPSENRKVWVDPVSVELFTGIRDAVTHEPIFEGDLVRLQSPLGRTIHPDAKCPEQDYVGEICMPLDIIKPGARKRLYLYGAEGVVAGKVSRGFMLMASLWDSMEWVKVGRPNDEGMVTIDGKIKHLSAFSVTPKAKAEGAVIVGKNSNVFHAAPKGFELFGTRNRRAYCIRHFMEFTAATTTPWFEAWKKPEHKEIVLKWLWDYEYYDSKNVWEARGSEECPDNSYLYSFFEILYFYMPGEIQEEYQDQYGEHHFDP